MTMTQHFFRLLNSSSACACSVLEIPTSLPDVSLFLFLPDSNDKYGMPIMEAKLLEIEIDDIIKKTMKRPTAKMTAQLPR
jgi:hypothetical protein